MGKWELSNYYDNIEKKCLDVIVREDGFGITVEKSELKNCLKALVDEHNKDVIKLKKQIEDLKQQNVEFAGSLVEDDIQKDKVIDTIKYLLKLLGDK